MNKHVLNFWVLTCSFISTSLLGFSATASSGVELMPSGRPDRAAAKVYLPSNYESKSAWPVILLLHGYEESQGFISRYFFGSDAEILNNKRFILVVPEGLAETAGHKYHYWNASDACCDFAPSKVDDTKYLTELIDQVSAKYKVDKQRVFATGHSNGAFMAHRLACASSDRIAAIAAFAGMTTKKPENCTPQSAVSILQINALDDQTIKFGGDKGFPPLAAYPSAEESVQRWVGLNQCRPEPIPGENAVLTNNFRFGLVDATSRSWSGCAGGTEVVQYQIQPYTAFFYIAHAPLLSWNFTETVVSFLLSHPKQ